MRKLTKKRLNEDVLNLISGGEPQATGNPRLMDFMKRNRTALPVPEQIEKPPEMEPIVQQKNKRYPFMRR